jgi:hypothetical protein
MWITRGSIMNTILKQLLYVRLFISANGSHKLAYPTKAFHDCMSDWVKIEVQRFMLEGYHPRRTSSSYSPQWDPEISSRWRPSRLLVEERNLHPNMHKNISAREPHFHQSIFFKHNCLLMTAFWDIASCSLVDLTDVSEVCTHHGDEYAGRKSGWSSRGTHGRRIVVRGPMGE